MIMDGGGFSSPAGGSDTRLASPALGLNSFADGYEACAGYLGTRFQNYQFFDVDKPSPLMRNDRQFNCTFGAQS